MPGGSAGDAAGLLWRFKGNMRFPAGEAFDDGSWLSVLRGSGRETGRGADRSSFTRAVRVMRP